MSREDIASILSQGQITPLFQPIISRRKRIIGYEALSRGPSASLYYSPIMLFEQARRFGQLTAVEILAWRRSIQQFFRLGLPGKLFLNAHPETLLSGAGKALNAALKEYNGAVERIVIEVTDEHPVSDITLLSGVLQKLQKKGFAMAIDALESECCGVRIWSELHPDYLKIDRYFIEGLHQDAGKQQYVKSIVDAARRAGAEVIAVGVEQQEEHQALAMLGVELEQGYYLARPDAYPARELRSGAQVLSGEAPQGEVGMSANVGSLARQVPPVQTTQKVREVAALFIGNPQLRSLAVVDEEIPKGLVQRHQFMTMYATQYGDALWGKRAISKFMRREALVVQGEMSVEQFSQQITEDASISGEDDFIVVDVDGRYLGVGTFMDLLRKITALQIRNARYANPLTQLPGNVPIAAHIDDLLNAGIEFRVAYCDLDNFKAFNDTYGYAKGDELIMLLGKLLREAATADFDFVGHVGGDDFILLLRSDDWHERCAGILRRFSELAPRFYRKKHIEQGGFHANDRNGNRLFFPIVTLSIGVVSAAAGRFPSHHEVAVAASEVKHQAKKREGNVLFVDRRRE